MRAGNGVQARCVAATPYLPQELSRDFAANAQVERLSRLTTTRSFLMTMSMGTTADGPMTEINTTPLIDVMLVLLIMLILTLPAMTHAIKLDLPGARIAVP